MARERTMLILPFEDVYTELWQALDSTMLSIGGTPYQPGHHSVTASVLAQAVDSPVQVALDIDTEAVRDLATEAGLGDSDIRVSVVTQSQFTNLFNNAFTAQLSEDIDFPLSIDVRCPDRPDLDPVRAAHSGFVVRAVLTLDKERSLHPGTLAPYRKHAILSEASFRIAPSGDAGVGLEIYPLNSVFREAEHIPKDVLVYLRPDDSPLSASVLADATRVYLDSEVLNRIKVDPGHPDTKLQKGLLKHTIFVDLARAAVELAEKKAQGHQTPAYAEIRQTLLVGSCSS